MPLRPCPSHIPCGSISFSREDLESLLSTTLCDQKRISPNLILGIEQQMRSCTAAASEVTSVQKKSQSRYVSGTSRQRIRLSDAVKAFQELPMWGGSLDAEQGAARAAQWAKTCRDLQKEAVEGASGTTDLEAKQSLLSLAETYKRLAERAELHIHRSFI